MKCVALEVFAEGHGEHEYDKKRRGVYLGEVSALLHRIPLYRPGSGHQQNEFHGGVPWANQAAFG